MHHTKQIILYLALISILSCSKETKEGETRNIKYLDERLKAFVPSYHEEYVKFDQGGKVLSGFYYTYLNTTRKDQTCANNCSYIQTYSNYIRLNPETLVSYISVSSINDTPCIDVSINTFRGLNTTRLYLNAAMTDIDSTLTKDKNILAQFSKFPYLLVGGKMYYNVYLAHNTRFSNIFVYSKEYGIILVENGLLGHLEILK